MKDRLAELVRFGLVGASSTILYFAVYVALSLLGAPYVAASILAFLASGLSGYVLHRSFTFKTGGGDRRALVSWLLLQASLLAINLVLLSALIHGAGLDGIVAQLVALPVVPLASYFISRRRIFGQS